jgi:hypothetical protein
MARLGAVMVSMLLSVFVGFVAQVSSPDYRRLFLSILPFAVVDAALIVFVCASKEKGKVWLVAVPGFLGFASYFEMACRVIFGLRLL